MPDALPFLLAVFYIFLFCFPLDTSILSIMDFTSPKEHFSFYFHVEDALVCPKPVYEPLLPMRFLSSHFLM